MRHLPWIPEGLSVWPISVLTSSLSPGVSTTLTYIVIIFMHFKIILWSKCASLDTVICLAYLFSPLICLLNFSQSIDSPHIHFSSLQFICWRTLGCLTCRVSLSLDLAACIIMVQFCISLHSWHFLQIVKLASEMGIRLRFQFLWPRL